MVNESVALTATRAMWWTNH